MDQVLFCRGSKVRRPGEAVIAMLRILDAEVEQDAEGNAAGNLRNALNDLTQPLFMWPSPDGYPDEAACWVSTDGINDDGLITERLSPYWRVLDQHHAYLGAPRVQDELAEPFTDPAELQQLARENRNLYSDFLRWSAILDNLELNNLFTSSETTTERVSSFRISSSVDRCQVSVAPYAEDEHIPRQLRPLRLGVLQQRQHDRLCRGNIADDGPVPHRPHTRGGEPRLCRRSLEFPRK